MFNIDQYLKKFTKIGKKEKEAEDLLKETISNIVGGGQKIFITIRGSTAFVNCPAVIKNLIFINKDKILGEYRKKSTSTIRDIR